MKTTESSTYEEFHASTGIQTKIITKNNFTYRIILAVIDTFVASGKKILDIGCGAGTLSLYLASRGHDVSGIDIAGKAIDSCRISAQNLKLAKKVHFTVMDFPNIVPKGRFDTIICCEVIEHLKNDERALQKIKLLLTPGGIAIVSTPSKHAPLFRLGLLKRFDEQVGHLRRYSLSELVHKSQKAGFTVLATRRTEGILRNFLFTHPIGGKAIRLIKFFLSDMVTFFDNMTLPLFGESQIFVILQKPL